MIASLLRAKLNRDGYFETPTKNPAYTPYIKLEQAFINMLLLVDCREESGFSLAGYEEAKKGYLDAQKERNSEVHIMTIFLYENEQPDIDEYMSWKLNCQTGELIISENNVEDFYGLKSYLQSFLVSANALIASKDMKAIEKNLRSSEEEEKYEKSIKRKPAPAIILFVTINIIIFISQLAIGDAFTESGCMNSVLVRNGEYFRLFTSMFLHADVTHLFSNMILLYFLGEMIEHLIGTPKIGVIYLLSGIIGNVISYGYHMFMKEEYTALGASGGVYGLIGIVLYLVLVKCDGLNIPLKRMVILIAYCIYSSIVGEQIDVGGHIGGLIAGFILAAILCHKGGRKSEN